MLKSLGSLGLAILLTLALVSLSGCSSAPAAAPTLAPAAKQAESKPAAAQPTAAAPAAANKQPIKIGFVGGFTGVVADLGNANVGGAKLAVEDVNKAGGINGRPLEMTTYDDTGDPATSVTRVQKAITSDGAQAIIGGTHAATTMANRVVTNQAKMVHMSPQAQNRELTDGMPWLFRVGTVDLHNAKALVELMIKQGYKKPALQYSTSAFGESGGKSLKEALEAKGIKWVDEQKHKEGSTDLTAQVLASKNAGADVLLTWAQGVDAALMAKTKKQLGFDVPMMGLDSQMHASALPIAGDAYEGVIAVSIGDTSRTDVQEMFARFEKANGTPPATIYSPCQGYDAVQILARGLRKVDPTGDKVDQEKLKAAIEGIQDYQGMTGPKGTTWKFGATNHNGLPEGASVFYKVQSGKWVRFSSLPEVLQK
ncbi:MAG: ABC transporter substrate-binding protein [Chloroflexota bacterium]